MKTKEAQQLKIGDHVQWTQTERAPECHGIVQEIGPGGLRIKWDDGQDGWISFSDTSCFEKASCEAQS